MSFDIIGKATPKRDGLDKVTGRTQYLHDMTLPRMAHGAILRTQFPHARIVSIDTTRAERLPGVIGVITADTVEQRLFGYFLQRSSCRARRPARGPGSLGAGRHKRRCQPVQGLAFPAMSLGLAPINFFLAVQCFEQGEMPPHALRSSEEKKTAGVKRVMEQGDKFFLQFPAHIDHKVAAAYQVQP